MWLVTLTCSLARRVAGGSDWLGLWLVTLTCSLARHVAGDSDWLGLWLVILTCSLARRVAGGTDLFLGLVLNGDEPVVPVGQLRVEVGDTVLSGRREGEKNSHCYSVCIL